MTSSIQAYDEGKSRFRLPKPFSAAGQVVPQLAHWQRFRAFAVSGKNTAGRVNDDGLSFYPLKWPPRAEKNLIRSNIYVATPLAAQGQRRFSWPRRSLAPASRRYALA